MSETIINTVNEVLLEDPHSRDSDTWLVLQVLRKLGFKIYLDYSQLKDMPSFESITRCKRHLQNDKGKYAPVEEVDKFRRLKEEGFKKGEIPCY